MNARTATLLVISAALLVPGFAVAQQWDEIAADAIPMAFEGERAIASSEVADGFAAFEFSVPEAGEISIEVAVTDVRVGLEYEDDDSVLFLFEEDGYLIDENDDGPRGFESMLNGVFLGPGTYYAIVTTHPRFVEVDANGNYAGFDGPGLSSFAFDFIVTEGRLDIDDYSEDPFGDGAPVVYGLNDVLIESQPARYEGGRARLPGRVTGGFYSFEITSALSGSVDIEVVVSGEAADSYLTIVDRDGTILAQDDDGGDDGASLIAGFDLVDGAIYYPVVTSWPNYPETGASGELLGFSESGHTEFGFDLVISPASTDGQADGGAIRLPDADEAATSFEEIVANADRVVINAGRGIAPGVVAAGYESFEIAPDTAVDATIEVVVTGILQGRLYEDSDSMLSLYSSDGRLIASDDDGGEAGASRISNVRLSASGPYYAVVTTYPNEPAVDGDGFFESVSPDGESHIEFDLVVRTE